jgi:hypothetical protein
VKDLCLQSRTGSTLKSFAAFGVSCLIGAAFASSPSAQEGPAPTCFGRAATIVGTIENDTIVGTAASDVIVGLGGSDNISGRDGADYICAGENAETPATDPEPAREYVDGKNRNDGGAGDDRCVRPSAAVGALNCERT